MGVPNFLFKMLSSCVGQAIKSKISNEDWQEKVVAAFSGTAFEIGVNAIKDKVNSEKKATERLLLILKESFNEINKKYDYKFYGADDLLISTDVEINSEEDLLKLLIEWSKTRKSVVSSLTIREIESFAKEFYDTVNNRINKDNELHQIFSIEKIIALLDDINNTVKGESQSIKDILNIILELLAGKPISHKIVTITTPISPSNVFKGREKEIEDIREKAKTEKVVLMNGMGGIGKTEICRYLFNYYSDNTVDEVEYIGWINYNESLESSFFGNFIDVKGKNPTEYKKAVKAHIDTLGKKLLLFVDNANDISYEEANELSSYACRIIMTSRKNNIERFRPYEIKKLPPDICLKIYQEYSGDTNEDNVQYINDIIKLADYHTYTVELLAKTQESSGLSAHELLEQLQNSGFSLEGIEETIDGIHGTDVTNEIFIEHLAKIFDISQIAPHEEQINALKLFSLIAPNEAVKKAKIKEWFSLKNLNAVNALIKSGWLKTDENNEISIHPVISEVVRYKYPAEYDFAENLVIKIGNELFTSREKGLGTAIWSKLVTHSVAIVNCLNGTENKDFAAFLNNIGLLYQNMGDYEKALEYYNKVLNICEKVLGTEHPSTATSYNNIGRVYVDMDKHEKALEYYNKAINIYEKVLGTEHPDTATSYNNIGGVYYYMGDYEKALEYYNKALNIREKVLGTEHPDTATSYNNIGRVYDDMGKHEKALEYYNKALNIREKVLGTEHPDTAASYNNIGVLYINMGDYEKALEYYNKAINIYEKVLGTEHPDTATSYNNIGLLYKNMGDYEKALEYNNKAINIREKVLGINHPNTKVTYGNIAVIYFEIGDMEKAAEFFEKYKQKN